MNRIILPNTDPVKVEEIPRLIADAIYPGLGKQILTHLFKITRDVHGASFREWLTEDDWDKLNLIWADVPNFNDHWPKLKALYAKWGQPNPGVSISIWNNFEEAYKNNAPDDLGWTLEAVVEDFDQLPALRATTVRAQTEDLFRAIRAGHVSARDGNTRSVITDAPDEQLLKAIVAVDDLRKYVAPMGLNLLTSESQVDKEGQQTVKNQPPIFEPNKDGLLEPLPVPGKLPRTAASRFAVETAWKLECELGRRPDAKAVMDRLIKLAKLGTDCGPLTGPGANGRSVHWLTNSGKVKNYDILTLRKTLENWGRTRK